MIDRCCMDCGTSISRMSRKGRCPACYQASRLCDIDIEDARSASEQLRDAILAYFAKHHWEVSR